MRQEYVRLTSLLGFVLFFFAFSLIILSQPSLAHAYSTNWQTYPGSDGVSVYDVSAISANDVWAVGRKYLPERQATITIALHWNGQAWEETTPISPSDNTTNTEFTDQLLGVDPISPNDVWAVGNSQATSGGFESTLIEHWDGTHWQVIQSQNSGTNNIFNKVEAISSNNVWVVGSSLTNDFIGQILHWDGTNWTLVSTEGGRLQDISAVNANNIWAVGSAVVHWDGTQWSRVETPAPGEGISYEFNGVKAISANDIWVVGRESYAATPNITKQLTLHWDGTIWKKIPTAELGENVQNADLFSVNALAPNNVWAVGLKLDSTQSSNWLTLVVHWNGVKWTVKESPNGTLDFHNILWSIEAISPNELWAVGTNILSPLLLHGIVVEDQLSALSPAKLWLSKAALNFAAKFDLLAQVYKDTTLVSSGQINNVSVGPNANNPLLMTIPFNSFTPLDFPQGSSLKMNVSVRKACSGLSFNNANATLWYNDSAFNSQFGVTIGSATSSYFLRDAFALTTTVGTGRQKSIVVSANCNTFQPFGTWSITP